MSHVPCCSSSLERVNVKQTNKHDFNQFRPVPRTQLSARQSTSCPSSSPLPDSPAWHASYHGCLCFPPGSGLSPPEGQQLELFNMSLETLHRRASAHLSYTSDSTAALQGTAPCVRPHSRGTAPPGFAGAASSARRAPLFSFLLPLQPGLAGSSVSFKTWLRCHFLQQVFHFFTHRRPVLSAPLSWRCPCGTLSLPSPHRMTLTSNTLSLKNSALFLFAFSAPARCLGKREGSVHVFRMKE